MKVEIKQIELPAVEAELPVVGLYDGGALPSAIADAAGAGDAKGGFKKLSMLHPDTPGRVLVVGLGKRDEVDAERLRVAAAVAAKEAGRLEAASLVWALPDSDDDGAAAEAIVTGTILGSYRFDRFKRNDPEDPPAPRLESLTLLGPAELAAAAETARVCAEAQNRARDLQSTPANFATPAFLAARAEEIAAGADEITVEVLGRDEMTANGMGGMVAVSQGSAQEPRLIVLRYSGGGAGNGPTLGLVGKGVTFDTGGI
ncbi:MAG: M17 family peptidase N-terminal domain-containing protein, partial [Solirubrobacterales bacterium]